MASGSLEYLAADRGIRSGVANHARADGRETPFCVAADLVVHRDRVPLRVKPNGLFARQRELDRTPRHRGEQRRLRLDGHVLFSAERAPVRDELDVEVLLRDAQEAGYLPSIVEDALSLAVEREAAVRTGFGQGTLWLEKEVLDALRLPRARHDVRAPGEPGVCVPLLDLRA